MHWQPFLMPLGLAVGGGVISTIIILLWPRSPRKAHQKIGLMALEGAIARLLAEPGVVQSHLEMTIAAYDLACGSMMVKDPVKVEYARALVLAMGVRLPFSPEWRLCLGALSRVRY